jgi:hypothetical protein
VESVELAEFGNYNCKVKLKTWLCYIFSVIHQNQISLSTATSDVRAMGGNGPVHAPPNHGRQIYPIKKTYSD